MPKKKSNHFQADEASLKRAIKFFNDVRPKSREIKKKQDSFSETYARKICTRTINTIRDLPASSGYLPLYVTKEMRNCFMRHDWFGMQRLFPSMLHLSYDQEYILWRYALILMLHNPMSDMDHIYNFFNLCVGTHNPDRLLQKILTLPSSVPKS